MRQLENMNLSDELYARVEETARKYHRSVAEQAAELVAIGLSVDKLHLSLTVADKLRLTDEVRGETKGAWLTEDFIRRARDEGRE